MLLHPGIGGRRRMVLGLASAFLTGYHIWIAYPVRFQRIRPRRRNRRPGSRGWTHKNERRLRLACYANHSSRLNFCNHAGISTLASQSKERFGRSESPIGILNKGALPSLMPQSLRDLRVWGKDRMPIATYGIIGR